MMFKLNVNLLLFHILLSIQSATSDEADFVILTVATHKTCEFRKFAESVASNQIPMKVLGKGQQWRGFGQKLAILRQELESYSDENIVMVTDSYDVLVNGGTDEIIERFKSFDARILFSTDSNCWPDEYLCSKVPHVDEGKNLLNSGLFIGYAKELYRALNNFPFHPELENDQRFFYRLYTNSTKREELVIKLDHRSQLFQTIDGGLNNIDIVYEGQKPVIRNTEYKTNPLIIHTPSYCKGLFNSLSAFIPQIWNGVEHEECSNSEIHSQPIIQVSVLFDKIQSKVEDFLWKLYDLDYPKEKIQLYLRQGSNGTHNKVIEIFAKSYKPTYRGLKVVRCVRGCATSLKALGFESYFNGECAHYFNVNDISVLENRQLLRQLVAQERNATASFMRLQQSSADFMFFLSRYDHCNNRMNIYKNMTRLVIGMF